MLTSTTKERLLLSTVVFNAIFFLLVTSFTTISHAESERVDFDLDNDGLIEINDLADLDEIRNHPDGKALYGKNIGCPNAEDGTINGGCFGFELTTDLDFDTNQDGAISELDEYWNNGVGWEPIKTLSAHLNGNHYSVKNLFINNTYYHYIGLFAKITNANVQNLRFSSVRVNSDHGYDHVGALTGYASNSDVSEIVVDGTIKSAYSTGGVIGSLNGSTVRSIFVTGSIHGQSRSAGVSAFIADSTISDCFVSAEVSGADRTAGIAVDIDSPVFINRCLVTASFENPKTSANFFWGLGSIQNSYSPSDLNVGSHDTILLFNNEGYSVFTLPIRSSIQSLKCIAESEYLGCVNPNIYKDWATQKSSNGEILWDFGSASQLPGMVFNGVVYRDSDGDGVIDEDDAFTDIWAASVDSDADGHPERWKNHCDSACQILSGLKYDAFPQNNQLSIDADQDGIADAWNSKFCDEPCQQESNYILDSNPNDFDNDGIPDSLDTDDNNDGVDDVDFDSDGLIDIRNLNDFNSIRFQLDGSGFRQYQDSNLDQSGCPLKNINGKMKRACWGYELTSDLNFDTNHNGQIDEDDQFWNNGLGWTPLGNGNQSFTGTFNGNNYSFLNFYFNDTEKVNRDTGIFGSVRHAKISNITIAGSLTSLRSEAYYGGLLASNVSGSIVSNIVATGIVDGGQYTGGAIGAGHLSTFNDIFTSGEIPPTTQNAGGIIGLLSGSELNSCGSLVRFHRDYTNGGAGVVHYVIGSTINDCFYNGKMTGVGTAGIADVLFHSQINNSYAAPKKSSNIISQHGGLAYSISGSYISNSYWASDTSRSTRVYIRVPSGNSNETFGIYSHALYDELACYTSESPNLCSQSQLFNNWKTYSSEPFNPTWDFGQPDQLPGIFVGNRIMRDQDDDGSFDHLDKFPNNKAAFIDDDDDGYPDSWSEDCDLDCVNRSGLIYDAFPNNKNVAIDTDLDGRPDAWNDSCGYSCQSKSIYELDSYIYDYDNDAIPDSLDLDDNNDGVIDIDADSDGLVDIFTLDHLNAVRFELFGHGLKMSENSTLDQSGCPVLIIEKRMVRSCVGYELLSDLDFDSNGDGYLSEEDNYWNKGNGWIPIGNYNSYFQSVFEGNGHLIRNFYSNDHYSVRGNGLFGSIYQANIRNFSLTTNKLGIRSGSSITGGITGIATESLLSNISFSGLIKNEFVAGGIAGSAFRSTFENIFVTGYIEGKNDTGGIVGTASDTSVTNGFSTARVLSEEDQGALAGRAYGFTYSNAYWAKDTTGQLYASNSSTSQSNQAGLLLQQLKCPKSDSSLDCADITLYENWNENDLIWDFGTNEQLPGLVFGEKSYRDGDGDGLLDRFDSHPIVSITGFDDTDGDGSPDFCDSVCLATGMTEDLDDDNDGIPDVKDGFRTIHIGSLEDTDNDGIPNECSNNCIERGLSADLDDDGDNVPDEQDFYSLISLNGLTDTDQDGIPNKCDLDCIALGMSEDLDDDNDSIPDTLDGFPEVAIGGLTDTDGDGRPDECDDACLALGMKADDDDDNDQVTDGQDKFPLDPTEHLDTDLDGIGNNADTDDDNDGVLDELDPDINQDNGKPTLTKAPANKELSADESGVTVTIDSIELLNELAAIDALDANPTFKAFFDSQTVHLNQVESITLNTGLNTIHWYAMDESGNLSEPQTQTIKVYPKAGFVSEKVVTGETSEASIDINLSGESPIYPIELTIAIDVDNSTVTQNDFVQGQFDLTANHIVTIEKQEGRLQNTQAELIIPLLRDLEVEQEEVLTLKLIAVHSGNLELPLMQITDSHKKMELVVTDENLPPSLDIEVFQGGQKINDEEVIVDITGGQLDFKASSIDPNGDLVHFEWKLEGLTMDLKEDTTTWSVDPSRFLENESYALEVTAIDSSDSSIRTTFKLDFKAIDSANDNLDDDAEEAIGSANALWLLMLFSLFRKRGICKK